MILEKSWRKLLQAEFEKPYFEELNDFVNSEYEKYTCFPNKELLFQAFNLCPFNAVKAVIIGQDPYHGVGQANGLCFSVNEGIKHPPSLVNILKEREADLGILYPLSGNLVHWASQGVLLLNATLSVREQKAGSHQKKGWEQFTDAVISLISENKKDVVFLLWGGYAKKKGLKIDKNKHCILTSGHPSPLSANRGYWYGNKHFSKTNAFLVEQELPIINW